jgi:hypothetical protein
MISRGRLLLVVGVSLIGGSLLTLLLTVPWEPEKTARENQALASAVESSLASRLPAPGVDRKLADHLGLKAVRDLSDCQSFSPAGDGLGYCLDQIRGAIPQRVVAYLLHRKRPTESDIATLALLGELRKSGTDPALKTVFKRALRLLNMPDSA